MIKVLFVCLGNICRSPMAEGLFRKEVISHGLSIEIDSAATSSWEAGNPPHHGTQKVLRRRGVDTSQMYSRQVQRADFEDFDYIIGMDQQNVRDLKKLASSDQVHKIHLFMEVVPEKHQLDVPDPWYTGDFMETERLIDEGNRAWINKIRSES